MATYGAIADSVDADAEGGHQTFIGEGRDDPHRDDPSQKRSTFGFRLSGGMIALTAVALFSSGVFDVSKSGSIMPSSLSFATTNGHNFHPHAETFEEEEGLEDAEGDATDSADSCGKGCSTDKNDDAEEVVNPFTASPYVNDDAPERADSLVAGDDQTQYSVINVTNSYTNNRTSSKQVGADYPWAATYLAVVEPFRDTTFSLGDLGAYTSPYPTITWRIEGVNMSGASVVQAFEDVNRVYKVELFVHDHDTNELSTYESHYVFCKYVRRELRDLHQGDREAFLSAMATLYATDTDTGRVQYGAQYKSALDFVRIHNSLSGRLDCDHLHGGLGFLPQHAAMTYSLELALQSIDPSIAMPFWDYTIEQSRMSGNGDNAIQSWYDNSEIFQDEWFGPMGKDEDHFVVTGSGRFSNLPVPKDTWKEVDPDTGLTTVTNPWGLMRSPWNTNKSPYLSRSSSSYGFMLDTDLVPGCASHYDILKEEVWSGFGFSIQEAPHGSLHILVGGTWGADYASYMDQLNYQAIRAKPMATITLARIWRKGWMECPEYCSMDTKPEDCKCACTDLSQWEDEHKVKKMLSDMYPGLASAPDFLEDDNGTDISTEMLELFCNTDSAMNPHVGDFMQSSSPLDPLFWPTHPTLDRLWQWRKINGFANDEWSNNTCSGHNYNDTTVWHDLFNEVEDAAGSLYSIADLMDMFNPTLPEVPYIYDTFEWPHCAEQGYPLDLLPDEVVVTGDDAGWGKGTQGLDDDNQDEETALASALAPEVLDEADPSPKYVGGEDSRTDPDGNSDTTPEKTRGSSVVSGWQSHHDGTGTGVNAGQGGAVAFSAGSAASDPSPDYVGGEDSRTDPGGDSEDVPGKTKGSSKEGGWESKGDGTGTGVNAGHEGGNSARSEKVIMQ